MFWKKKSMVVQDSAIAIKNVNGEEFISITDMVKSKDGGFFVTDWLRNRNTLEFLGVWEQMNNPNFNYGEFAMIKEKSGLNNFKISVKEWVKRTGAIGVVAQTGRYGGTYAHKDIAFEFGTWISPAFKLYLIKEYQRLKEIESNQYNLEWDVRRVISKTNYQLQTDAIKEYIIPASKKWCKKMQYAEEADILNVAIFGMTSKEWKQANPERHKTGENIRDSASINELIIVSNAESLNSEMIRDGIDKKERFNKIQEIAQRQLDAFNRRDVVKSFKKTSDDIYVMDHKKKDTE